MPHPLDRADLRPRVQTRLDTELDRWEGELAEIGPDVADLIDPVRSLLQGGKRLRAGFAYWGWRAAGQPDHGHNPPVAVNPLRRRLHLDNLV